MDTNTDDLTVKQITDKKVQLQMNINHLLNRFEEETGVYIEKTTLRRNSGNGYRGCLTMHVATESPF
jgi:hypothetical protein